MNFRFWYSLCLLFLILNLEFLIDDYNLVNYMIVDKNDDLYSESNKFLICILFEDIKEEDKLIDSQIINKNVPNSELLNYTIRSIELNLNISNLFKLNKTFVLYDSFCFLINKEQLETDRPLNGLVEYYPFNWLYPDPNIIHPIRSNYIYQDGGKNYHTYNLKIKRQKIYDRNYLKNSNCLNQILSNRIECINKCLDLIYTDEYYGFYNYSDNRKFNFELIANTRKKESNSIEFFNSTKYLDNNKYSELIRCFDKCPNNNCNYEIYNAIRLLNNQFKTFKGKIIDIESSIYLAYYLIDDFWLQLIGLICLITGNCLINLLLSFWNFVFNENRREYFQILIYYHQKYFKSIKLKFIFLSLFLLFILIQSSIMIKEYDYKSRYPNRTSYIDYSTKLPSLIICFPIQKLIFNHYNLLFKINRDILLNYTYKEIENKSNFNESKLIKKIEFVYGNRKRSSSSNNEFKWKINNNEIYFKRSRLENRNHNYLSRCFRIELEYSNRLRYEYLNPIHYLEIEFRTLLWNLFLIDKNQNFTLNSTEIKEGYSFRKIEISKLINCNNLKNDKMIRINRCINERFIDQFDSLPLYSLIDKNELISLNLSIDNLKFNTNRSNYDQIEADCRTKFNNLTDCNQIKFEETFKETQAFAYESIRINLNYETYYEYEFEQSLIKLLLNILNLVSISLGVNVIGLLSSLSRLIKLKLIKIIIITICLIGFLVHNFFIFKGIVEEKLSHSLYFEKLDTFKYPNILICIDEKIKIDDNYKLTPNYLNKITNQSNLDQIFNGIAYYNKTNFNEFEPYGDNMDNDEISIKTLYFLNFKCFEIKLEIEFTENDLYVIPFKYFLEIYFNKNFIGDFKLIYILYRHSNSNQFSDLLKYKFEFDEDMKFKYTAYQVVFELIEIDKEDNFELIKNPLGLLYGTVNLDDTTSYLNNLKNQFKKLTNSTTREIMIENDNFNLEIDEDLFKQYYLQIQNYTDHHYPKSSNLLQNYYDSQNEQRSFIRPSIEFSMLSRKKKIKITNQDNNAKLLLNLLNTLSLWLDICILDLYKYLHISVNPFKFTIIFTRYLIKLKIKLRNVSLIIILN